MTTMSRPRSRTELQRYLETIASLPEDRVLFQPPEGAKFRYPAITYRLSDLDQRYANNGNYVGRHCYEVTVISANPDSKFEKIFSNLPACRFLRAFANDNLYHWVYRLWTTT